MEYMPIHHSLSLGGLGQNLPHPPVLILGTKHTKELLLDMEEDSQTTGLCQTPHILQNWEWGGYLVMAG